MLPTIPQQQQQSRYRIVVSVGIFWLLLGFFWHVRLTIQPTTQQQQHYYYWPPIILDAHDKIADRIPADQRLAWWEMVVILAGPIAIHQYLYCPRIVPFLVQSFTKVRQGRIAVGLATLIVLSIVWLVQAASRMTTSPRYANACTDQWILTDVGYIHGGYDKDDTSLSRRTLCQGRVWEPHVAKAIDTFLYHQGASMDVGAFTGYHTLRMARQSTHVYAIEGRHVIKELQLNLRRNNAHHHTTVWQQTIREDWKLPEQLHRLLTTNKNINEQRIAFIKIDCEGCELLFLEAAKPLILSWHPTIVVEIQDDTTRQQAVENAGKGQQMIAPQGSRQDVLDWLEQVGGYTVEPLVQQQQDGSQSWDYLALWLPKK